VDVTQGLTLLGPRCHRLPGCCNSVQRLENLSSLTQTPFLLHHSLQGSGSLRSVVEFLTFPWRGQCSGFRGQLSHCPQLITTGVRNGPPLSLPCDISRPLTELWDGWNPGDRAPQGSRHHRSVKLERGPWHRRPCPSDQSVDSREDPLIAPDRSCQLILSRFS
jgi:hypothetical protein